MYYDDYVVTEGVENGRITAIDLVDNHTMNLIGSGEVAWKPDSSVLVVGAVELFESYDLIELRPGKRALDYAIQSDWRKD